MRVAGGEPSGGEVDLARIGLQARAGTSTGSLTRPKQSAQEKGATTSFTASAYWKFESTPLQERVSELSVPGRLGIIQID